LPVSSSVTVSSNQFARRASSASRSGRSAIKRKDKRSRTTLWIRLPLGFPWLLARMTLVGSDLPGTGEVVDPFGEGGWDAGLQVKR
jgi:hypothetical protein